MKVEDILKELAAAKNAAKEKGNSDFVGRVSALATLVDEVGGEITLAEIYDAVFPGKAVPTQRTQFSNFRTELQQFTEGNLILVKPDKRRVSPEEIICSFAEGRTPEERFMELARKQTEGLSKTEVSTPILAMPDELRIFVSFATEDRELVFPLLKELRNYLRGPERRRPVIWKFDEIDSASGLLPGEDIGEKIEEVMTGHPLGLMLVSPAWSASKFIQDVERPHYMGATAKGLAFPILLSGGDQVFRHDKELAMHYLFTRDGKPFDEVMDDPAERNKFFGELVSAIDLRVERALPQAIDAKEKQVQMEMAPIKEFFEKETKRARECERFEYIPNEAQRETAGGSAGIKLLDELLVKLKDPKSPAYIALLGETGSGKTTTCLELANAVFEDPEIDRLPLYFDLRLLNQSGLLERTKTPNLEEILEALLQRTNVKNPPSVSQVLEAVQRDEAILIWDGLDEILVGLTSLQGSAFYRQLRDVLNGFEVDEEGAGTLVFACRTQYFRSVEAEKSFLRSDQRDGVQVHDEESPIDTRNWLLPYRVLPFNESQIRAYLEANVHGIDVDRAFDLIRSIHDLKELASQPYLLSIIREVLPTLDQDVATGRKIRSVDLYGKLVDRWLTRDEGKHRFSQHHKPRLMELLAAELWREGARTLSAERIERWLESTLVRDPVWREAYGSILSSDERETLLEDFRTATFLGRWDGESFRFVHTSLLEYFLARYLLEALDAGEVEAWNLPEPSAETFDFLVELCQIRREESVAAGGRMDASLVALLQKAIPGRSQNALRFYLTLAENGVEVPVVDGADFSGLDLEGWRIAGTAEQPLCFPNARFNGARLNVAKMEHLECPEADFSSADLRGSEWQEVNLIGGTFSDAELFGSLWRKCHEGEDLSEATLSDDSATSILPVEIEELEAISNVSSVSSAPWESLSAIGHADSVASCTFSPDGNRVLSGSDDGTLKLWEGGSGRCLRTFEGHTNGVLSCAFSPEGNHVLSGLDDGTLKLWEAGTGRCLRTFEGHTSGVNACAFSPEGNHVLSGATDGTLKLWEAGSGRCLRTFEGHTKWVTTCAFSPEGNHVLSGAFDGTLKLWEAGSGRCLRTFEGHTDEVTSCAFSPEGSHVLSVSIYGTLKLWEAGSGQEVQMDEEEKKKLFEDGRTCDKAGNKIEITPRETLLLQKMDGEILREIIPMNDGEYAVLEPEEGIVPDFNRANNERPGMKVVGATEGAWRYLALYRDVEKEDGSVERQVIPAESFGPLPLIEKVAKGG